MAYNNRGGGSKSTWDPTIVSAKDRMMAHENAVTASANLTAALVEAGLLSSVDQAREQFEDFKEDVYTANLEAAGASAKAPSALENAEQLVTQAIPGTSAVAPTTGGGGGQQDPGSLEIKFGKYKGQTIDQVYRADPDYIEWIAEKGNNEFVKRIATEYLTTLVA